MASVAAGHGLFPSTVWDHPENAALKELRHDLYVLAPGDKLHIPDLEEKQEAIETGKRHTFRRRGVPEKLSVQLVDENDLPYANRYYTIEIDGQSARETTDDAGNIDHWIPPSASRAVITFEPVEGDDSPIVWELALGALAPALTGEGIGDRLFNLGFEPDEKEDTEEVVKAFQCLHGLEATGEPDEALIQALEREHGV